jgi:uncharacterized protein (UPF0332 family)
VSPRSEEFIAAAREWLVGARAAAATGFPPGSVSLAYYAMLYAARAALSEEDAYAKTHAGTWNLFAQTFVETGRFDRSLFAAARDVLPLRIATDYEALQVGQDKAEEVVDLAERFVVAVEGLYAD